MNVKILVILIAASFVSLSAHAMGKTRPNGTEVNGTLAVSMKCAYYNWPEMTNVRVGFPFYNGGDLFDFQLDAKMGENNRLILTTKGGKDQVEVGTVNVDDARCGDQKSPRYFRAKLKLDDDVQIIGRNELSKSCTFVTSDAIHWHWGRKSEDTAFVVKKGEVVLVGVHTSNRVYGSMGECEKSTSEPKASAAFSPRNKKIDGLRERIELLTIISATSPEMEERLQADREISRLTSQIGVIQSETALQVDGLL